ncbi:hypothetical protein BD413DRAFT_632318 [Trametes elegans]|nr:hypothetical protein BD413DRAFT_632318 [Trametes elegans]
MESGWKDHLHWGFLGGHVLVDGLRLDSGWSFFVASCLTACICFSERLLTYAMSKKWDPLARGRRRSRVGTALWRTVLYWIVTFDRLMYMLLGMTFSLGLIVIAVTCLAIGQFTIEYLECTPEQRAHHADSDNMKEPLLPSPSSDGDEPYTRSSTSTASYPPAPAPAPPRPAQQTRPRSKSKPGDIFIHPSDSNLARADAAAAELGLAGDTERVKANVYPAAEDPWQHGQGRAVARELLGR